MLEQWTYDRGDPAVIGPTDDRIRELNTSVFPWNTIVHLCRDFGSGACSGCSGILIDQRRVLTAGHCVWSLRQQGAPRRMFVIPGRRDRRTMPYGSHEAREFWVPRGFLQGNDRRSWDWGLVVLTRPITSLTRFAPLRALTDEALRDTAERGAITIAGYPSDRPIGTMWRNTERLVRATRRRLFHSVDTCPGHSGSAVLSRVDGRLSIVGVHTAGILDAEGRTFGCKPGTLLAPPGSVNSGIRLLPSIVEALSTPATPRSGPAQMLRFPR